MNLEGTKGPATSSRLRLPNDWPSAKATLPIVFHIILGRPFSDTCLFTMAGFFKSIYDWLLRLFWYVPSLPAPLLPAHVAVRQCLLMMLVSIMAARQTLEVGR